MKVKFKKLRENAKMPTKTHESDFCYDVYACDCIEVLPGVYKYPLGFALQIDEKEETVSNKIMTRKRRIGSSISMFLIN